MVFDSLKVENWQSLKQLDLELGGLTVITGPSSSGKSALVRSLRYLLQDPRGTKSVTHGQSSMAIRLEGAEFSVAFVKGKQTTYEMAQDGAVETFSKLGGSLPEKVQKALRISDRAFAGQFDRPYLLTETGSTVAGILGDLTDVSRVFAASHESSRQRMSVQSTIKIRKQDLEQAQEQLGQYDGLDAKLELLAKAQALETKMQQRQQAALRIRGLLTGLTEVKEQPETGFAFDKALQRVEAYRRLAPLLFAAEYPPDAGPLEQAQQDVSDLVATVQSLPRCNECGRIIESGVL